MAVETQLQLWSMRLICAQHFLTSLLLYQNHPPAGVAQSVGSQWQTYLESLVYAQGKSRFSPKGNETGQTRLEGCTPERGGGGGGGGRGGGESSGCVVVVA